METTAVGEAGQRQAKMSCGSGVGVGVTVVAVVVVVGVVVVVDGVGVGGLLLQLSFLWPMLAVDRTDTHTPTQRHIHRNIHTYTHMAAGVIVAESPVQQWNTHFSHG